MSSPVSGSNQGAVDRNKLIDESSAKSDENFRASLRMQELQEKVSNNNTTITAMSTIAKGQDDVLRAIANNLK